jgi:hypothetical protein
MSRQTELVESGFCVYLGALISGIRDLESVDFRDREVKRRISSFFNIGKTNYFSVVDYLESNSSWKDSTIKSANCAFYHFEFDESYVVHRGTAFIRKIYDEFRRLKNLDPDLRRLNVGDDKWNPSDIWITNKSRLTIPEFDTLDEYTRWLSSKRSDVIGVSLKFGGIELINGSKRSKIEFKNSGKSTNMKRQKTKMSAKNATLLLLKDDIYEVKIDFRQVVRNSESVGEIIGKSARHGKVSLSVINHILGENVRSIREIKEMDDYLLEISRLYRTIGMKTSKKELSECLNEKNNNQSWLIAKIQSLEIVSKILNHPERNDVIEKIFNYADSKGLPDKFEPSAYYKIS